MSNTATIIFWALFFWFIVIPGLFILWGRRVAKVRGRGSARKDESQTSADSSFRTRFPLEATSDVPARAPVAVSAETGQTAE